MTNLHAYFYLRNLSAFRNLLDARTVSGSSRPAEGRPGSGPRSWSGQQGSAQMTTIAQNVQLDNSPNARDAYGRTVLHVACADVAPVALEFVRALLGLSQTQIDVNAQDTESGWTALHRALYAGNLPAAILLLGRNDIDTSVRDLEGMTSFDVYNATVEGTAPDVSASAPRELLVWGSNRNATLGVGDANDRTYPEVIRIARPADVVDKLTGSARFSPIHVKQIAMSRLHTTVLTSEPRANLEACGFGGVGRLGTKHHAQYSLSGVSGLENQIITSIALGLDHTLVLTHTGDVLSWGFNRFHQLGYVIEPPTSTSSGAQPPTDASEANQIQVTPKRVMGPLRKEVVVGVAASKTASVCWTEKDLYSWGTNAGQLGYPKGTGWQVLPRKVALVERVIDVAISDKAMVCLLENKEVTCFWNDKHFKIQFPAPTFPHRYRAPQSFSRIQISKLTCTDTLFAALTTSGDVFLFTLPDDTDTAPNVRPQKVWTLRRRVAAVRDVALGGEGSVIVCTESGHVFVHTPRTVKGGNITSGSGGGVVLGGAHRTGKYHRMQGLQRVVSVSANSTGGFAAIRADAVVERVAVEGKSIGEELGEVQPYLSALGDQTALGEEGEVALGLDEDEEDDEEGESLVGDVKLGERLCEVVRRGGVKVELGYHVLHGGDMRISGAIDVPVHRAILAARCSVLRDVISGKPRSQDGLSVSHSPKTSTLSISGCHALSVLVLLNYLYSDTICAIWDRRVSIPLSASLSLIHAKPMSIRNDLQRLARVLDLPALQHAVETIGKRPLSPPDICLALADRNVFCHSVILRARSPFFSSFFDEPEWTRLRWDGVMRVELGHLEWRVMEFVFRWMCEGVGEGLFDDIGFVKSADELVDFIFGVMAAANELMLDQLSEICSTVILRHLTLSNCTSILTDASPLHAPKLKSRIHAYIAMNMECLLEKRMLDDIPHDTLKDLSLFVRAQQAVKLPRTRGGIWVEKLMDRWKGWVEQQDWPVVVVRTWKARGSPKVGPVSPRTPKKMPSFGVLSPSARPKDKERERCDGMFVMDEEGEGEGIPGLELSATARSSAPIAMPVPAVGIDSPDGSAGPVWKVTSGTKPERIDMRSIMANEAAGSRSTRSPTVRLAGFDGPSQPGSPSKTPQKDRTRQPSILATPPASASTSWREHAPNSGAPIPSKSPGEFPTLLELNARRAPSTPTQQKSSVPSPSAVPNPGTASTKPARPPPVPVASPPPAFPGLGPVIVPKRSASAVESGKKRNASDAWVAPPPMPSPPSKPTGSVSFSAIQQQQHAQKSESGAGKPKQSLRDIQEEEQRRTRELQQQDLARAREAEELVAEVDFMQWWNAEEARVKKQMEGDKTGGAGGARKGRRKGRGGSGAKKRKSGKEGEGGAKAPTGNVVSNV
ncbi:hypothetical protein BDV93DRAFT_565726 [Ceratobasidium sp. AG-I]|nr:hypothetical protein BDV93DRAFT_565726 [Ceratobasidium sp. AG-I]